MGHRDKQFNREPAQSTDLAEYVWFKKILIEKFLRVAEKEFSKKSSKSKILGSDLFFLMNLFHRSLITESSWDWSRYACFRRETSGDGPLSW